MTVPERPAFEGDFSTMWKLGLRPTLRHLTWDWWWWLVMLDDPEGAPSGQQLMVLWSTKDNDRVEVNGMPWRPGERPGTDDDGALLIDGMVCAWWYDGKRMHEPYVKQICEMVAMDDTHPAWPHGSGQGIGGGAVVPLFHEDMSMGFPVEQLDVTGTPLQRHLCRRNGIRHPPSPWHASERDRG